MKILNPMDPQGSLSSAVAEQTMEPFAEGKTATVAIDFLSASLVGDFTASANAYHAKKVLRENILPGGDVNNNNDCDDFLDEKLSRRSAFVKRCNSRKIKKKREKKINKNNNMKPHWGSEIRKRFTPSLSQLASWGGLDLTDEILREVEGLSALMIILTGANDYVTMSAGLFLYIREKFPKSISGQVVDYVREVLDQSFSSQDGEENVEPDSFAKQNSWVQFIKDVKNNWTLCKGNRLFGQFSKIFGLLVTFGLCNADNVTFDIKGYKFIEPDLKIVHGDAQDIISACCDTVVFWVETCHTAWKTKSFTPFLLGNTDAANLDMEYHELVRFWDLARNGNLLGMYGVTDSDFVSRLENMATKLKRLMPTLRGLDKQVVERKFSTILSIINDHAISKMAAGYRRAPFAIEFFGPSSQGKTFCAEQITSALFASAGIDNSKGKKFMFDSSKKHWDGARSDINHFIINDHGNVRSEFVEVSPCDAIQKICDNAPCVAPMADLARKEKTWLEPELVTVTTNVKDLDARLYSNCPYSIQRRMHVVIDVFAKEEFLRKQDGVSLGLDPNKVLQKSMVDGVYKPLPYDDIWELTVSVAVPPSSLKVSAAYDIVTWRGMKLERTNMRTVINYCIEMFAKHRKEQFDLVSMQDARSINLSLCGVDGCCQLRDHCMLHSINKEEPICIDIRKQCTFAYEKRSNDDDFYPQELLELEKREFEMYGYKSNKFDSHAASERKFGDRILGSFDKASKMVTSRILGDVGDVSDATESVVSFGLLTAARLFVRRFDWLQLIPTKYLENTRLQKVLFACDARRLRNSYIRKTAFQWSALAVSVGALAHCTGFNKRLVLPTLGAGFSWCALRQSYMLQTVKASYVSDLAQRNSLSPMLKTLRDENIEKVAKASAIIAVAYTLAKLYKRWVSLNPQGSLEPKTDDEVAQRDSEDNVWSKVIKRPLPLTRKSLLSCKEHLSKIISKNLVYGSVEVAGRVLMVNGLFLTSNVVAIPDHYFADGDELRVTFRKENPEHTGGKFISLLSKNTSILLPNTDMRLCYTPTGGSYKNILEYFPTDDFPAHNFEMLYRNKDGSLLIMEGKAKPGKVETVCNFQGGTYENLSGNTFAGLCGAVLISRGACGAITGIHLGGHSDTPRGCYGSFTKNLLEGGIQSLRAMEGVLVTGSAEKFEPQVLGVTVVKDEQVHKKSPINFMPLDSQIEYYGSCPGRTKAISRVKVTPISHIVADVCGVPNKWGPPKMNPDWFGWQTCLENLANPAESFPSALLQRAIHDYKKCLLPLYQSRLWSSIKPLGDKENINGIPGLKFMDAIKIGTSIGYPLSGPKSDHMLDVDLFDGDGLLDRKFKPHIMEEIERCERAYRAGERAYPIAKACKKDEVLSKEKCRIFYGNSIALTFLIRKYYLPIVRVLMMNPLKAECAVGINSHGPEWDEMMKHLKSKNDVEFLAGDYSKFDQKLPAQVLLAGLRILIDFARNNSNYGNDDINVMECMAGDMIYSIIAFDGNLIGLTSGGHISGNPLTAVLNSVCNSLNMRCCFFEIYPEANDFREACALITYGDDNAGSVADEYRKFNIKSCSEVMSKYGQVYTMPDKESDMVEFIGLDKLEFLKRVSVFHPELGYEIGALSEDSCFKMLHCFLREKNSPLSEEEACATNIDTALMEWFNHGRDKYEARRREMRVVAEKASLIGLCQTLDMSYDDRVEAWKERYDAQSGEEVDPEFVPLYTKALAEITMKAIALDTVILTKTVGEVDLAFQDCIYGVQHILILEVKDSVLPSARCKGRKQLHRICNALAIINPSIAYAGVMLTPRGYEAICMTGNDGHWEDADLPFSLWANAEQFERQVRLELYGL